MQAALRPESRHTWLLIVAREATASTGGPLMLKVRAARRAGGSAATLAAKLLSSAAQAACWPSMSAPLARVRARSRARVPSGELHTPAALWRA